MIVHHTKSTLQMTTEHLPNPTFLVLYGQVFNLNYMTHCDMNACCIKKPPMLVSKNPHIFIY